MNRCIGLALLLFAVVTPATAGQLYTSVDLNFDTLSGQATATSLARAEYVTEWWEPMPTVSGIHAIENTTGYQRGSSTDGAWSSFLDGYAIFGECGYRATIEANESNYWTLQGAGTAAQCCPIPDCWLNVSRYEGGDTIPRVKTVECFEVVDVTAYPYPSYEFDYWDGDIYSTNASVSVQVNGRPTSIVAHFREGCDPADPNCLCDPVTNRQCPCDRISDPNCDSGEPLPCDNCSPDNPNPPNSPILVNFAHGDYKLVGATNPVTFDIGATGTAIPIGWTAPGADEAFLCLDRNGNGKIDDGSELFGTATRLANGVRASNGFAALAEFDSNHDGVIDAKDAVWSRLLLWRDLNHDGRSQASELSPVANSTLKAISLTYHWTGRRDRLGNTFRYVALAWFSKGASVTARPVYDIFFVSVP